MSINKTDKTVFMLNVLNVVSCISVVLLHCNGMVWQFEASRHWIFQWFIETFFYFPVPIFIMISGVTLMDYRKKYKTVEYVRKRCVKVGIPYIVWSCIAMAWAITYSEYLPKDYPVNFKSITDVIVNQRALQIYWFFPAIFMVYALIPFVSMIPEEKRTRAFLYIIGFDVLTNGVMHYIFYFLGISYNSAFRNSFSGYIILAMLGWVLYNNDIKKQYRLIIYFLGVCGWLLRFVLDGRRSFANGEVMSIYGGYTNFNCLLTVSAVFLFFKSIDFSKIENKLPGKIINTLSKASFGVYLVHYYIMFYIVKEHNINMRQVSWIVMGTICVYLLSVSIVLILKKIPILKRIVP